MNKKLFFKINKKVYTAFWLLFLLLSYHLPVFSYFLIPPKAYAANSCGPTSSKSSSRVGGIALDQAATFLANMDDLKGAYYDEELDRIVFVGKTQTALPEFDRDDLAVAIKAVLFRKELPAVSIEDSTVSGKMDVLFYGGIENTRFGQVLLEADFKMKQYAIGYDENDTHITSSVSGYKSIMERYLDKNPDPGESNYGRQWITPDEVVLKKDDSTDSFVFEDVTMKLEYEPLSVENDPLYDDASEEFVEHHTDYFDDFADEIPAYKDTKQLAKIVAVVKWLTDNGIASDFSWAYDYTPELATTSAQVDALNVSVPNYNGYSYTAYGGVQYFNSNDYISDDGEAVDIKEASEAINAPKEEIHWEFTENSEEYEAVAVAADAFRSLGSYSDTVTDMSFPTSGDLNLEFTRTYSSFSGGQEGIGRGWSFMPARLVDNKPVAGGILLAACDAGDTYVKRSKLSLELNGQKEAYTYDDGNLVACNYLPDENSFHSTITPEQASPVRTLYHATTKDQTIYTFEDLVNVDYVTNYNLRLKSIADKNGAKINYNYVSSTSAQLSSISDDQGHTITLNYNDKGLISSISDWASRSVSYTYDADGNLTTVTDPRGNTTTYSYDSNNKLTSIEDREENIVLSNTYTPEAKISTQTDASGLTTTFGYDETNRILYATDSATPARTTRVKYDEKARVLEDIDALNNKFTYTYATESAPLTIRDKNNNLTTNTYDVRGNLTSVTYPDSKSVTYQYNLSNFVTSISDTRYGGSPKVTTFGYDSFGNLRFATESGKTTSYTYNGDGEILTKTNPLGNTITWTRDTFGNPLTEVDSLSKTTDFEYNAIGRLLEVTDPDEKTITYTYDNNGNLLTKTDGAGTVTYQYDKENRIKKTILPNTSETDFAYNDAGSVTSVTDELNNVTEYNYDNRKNLIARQDALDRTTQYEFDLINQATKSATPLGKVIKWEYDANGNIDKRIDENNQETDYTFNNMNRLTKIEYPDSSEVEYTYDDRGNLTFSESDVTDTTYTYDSFDRLTSISNSYSGTTSYEYDDADNLIELTYPNSQTVYYEYDDNNRLIEFTDWNSKSTTYTYNDNGTLATRTLPNDIETFYTYDSSNRLVGVRHEQDGTDLAEYTYVRNSLGNIISASESSGLILPLNPEDGFTAQYFDNKTLSGSPSATRVDPEINFHWRGSPAPGISGDEFSARWVGDIDFEAGQYEFTTSVDDGVKLYIDNSLVIDEWQDQPETLYSHIASMSAGTHEIKMEYYENAEYAVAELNINKIGPSNNEYYAEYWNNTELSGSPVVTRNEDGNLNEIWGQGVSSPHGSIDDTTWSARWTKTEYFKAGTYHFRTSTDDGVRLRIDSNLEYEHEYSGVYYVNKYLSEGNHTISMDYYQWDGPAYAQLTYEPIDVLSTPQTTLFTYDLIGRLINSEYPNQRSHEYEYDKVGNIKISTNSGQLSQYTYNNDNQLTNKDGATLTYDNRGNMTSDGIKDYTYDFENRLLGVFDDEADFDVEFEYDGDGNRVGKSINQTPRLQYATDVSGGISRILGINDFSNSTQTYYFYGVGPFAQGPDSDTYRQYYLEDGLGNVRYLVDNTGSNIQPYNYDPYGNQILGDGTADLQYKGEYREETIDANDLYYLRARYYNPTINRFVSRDPKNGITAEPQTQNGYNYVASDPINRIDPLGMDYLDLGISSGLVGPFGAGFGVQISSEGITPYISGGGITPGKGVTLTYSSQDPQPNSTSLNFAANYIAAGSVSYPYKEGPTYFKDGEVAIGIGFPLGASATINRTFNTYCW